MKKQESGITLVALVITIIVLVILVGVTITAAINSGIIGQTKGAADAYSAEQELEARFGDEAKRYAKVGHVHSYVYVSDTKVKCTCGDEKEVTDAQYLKIENGVVSAKSGVQPQETIVIPKQIDGETVTQIKSSGFSSYPLTTLVMPDSIQYIGGGAFFNCRQLTSVTLSPNIETIDNSAFGNCSALQAVIVPEGVKVLNGSFGGCSTLSYIELPESLTTIYNGAFNSCTSLKSITIPKGTTVTSQSFGGCSNLSTVVIEEGVTTVGTGAFASAQLKEVSLPSTITTLQAGAFATSSLQSIKVNMTLADWANVTKENQWAVGATGTVHCTDGDVAINP